MSKRTKYGELTTMMSFRVPNSMMDRVRDVVYLSIDNMQKDKSKEIVSDIVSISSLKSVKEPSITKFVPFTTKKIIIEGYGCLKENDSDICYWRDSISSALVFDDEVHLRNYLIKKRP